MTLYVTFTHINDILRQFDNIRLKTYTFCHICTQNVCFITNEENRLPL